MTKKPGVSAKNKTPQRSSQTSAERPTRFPPVISAERFLKLPEVMLACGKSRTSIYEDMGLGMFPRPVRIGKRAVAWTASSIHAWMQERIEQERQPLVLD